MSKNTAEQTNTAKEQATAAAAVSDAVFSKSTAVLAFSVLLAFVSYFLGAIELVRALDVAAAALIIFFCRIAQYIRLFKCGLTKAHIKNNKKNVDPRLTGSLGDMHGIGSTMGALAGIVVILSELFIVDGGAFYSESPFEMLPYIISVGLSIGVVIALITSRHSVRNSLYIIGGRTYAVSGDELLKKVSRSSHSEEMMCRLTRMTHIRIVAAIVFPLVITAVVMCGAGLVYLCWQVAFLSMITILLSECCTKANVTSFSDEKFPLYGGKSKNKCILNILLFILLAFFFLFSFPFRSVFTEYTPVHDFDYYSEEIYTSDIEIISIPYDNTDNQALFSGFFLFSCLFIATASGSFALKDGFDSLTQISTELLVSVASCAAVAMQGFVSAQHRLDFNQYIVVLSVVSFIVIVNMIAFFMEKKPATISNIKTK